MKELNSFLNNIYANITDPVFVYQLTGDLIYLNESALDYEQLDEQLKKPLHDIIHNDRSSETTPVVIEYLKQDIIVNFSSLSINNIKVIVAIIAHQAFNDKLELTEEVKRIMLETAVNDHTFYNQIGELVKNELGLNNLQITIPNQRQKELVNQYLSDDHDLLRSEENQTEYIRFIQRLITSPDLRSVYSKEELATNLNVKSKTRPKGFFFIPFKSQHNAIGGIGIFKYANSEKTAQHLKTLQTIADYLGIFYGFQHLEEELLQQTSRLNAIFESSSDLIWSVDRSMEVVSFNQNYFRAIFYKYQGGTVTEHFKDNFSESAPFDEFWETKYNKVFEGRSLHFEIELKHPNNVPVWKEIFLMPIFKANGTIEEVSGIARDISERKKTVEALHQEEEKFKQIFDSFQDAYVRIGLNGKINMISPSVEDMVGYTPKEVIGKDITDYYLYNIRTKEFFRKVIREETLRNIEIQLVGKNGQIIPCICNIRIIKNSKDVPVSIDVVCRDITEIKATNEALVSAKQSLEISLKAKEQFLANMSHEIRTPMNGIIGLLDMMLDTELTKKQTKYLDTIKQSSKLLLSLLNDILDLSKINAGKLLINYQALSIRKMLDNVETLFSSEVKHKQLNFSIKIAENIPEYVKSDKLRLLQVISNLISNAIKFTPEKGSITVEVDYVKPSVIKISVIDTGVGIEAKNIKKLFTNFTQINQSYSEKTIGAGLGLAISKNLVKLLGGKINVESTYGEGSTFWFTIKTKIITKNSIEASEASHNELDKPDYDIAKQSILVVDDHATNRMVAREILKKSGMVVDSADNAKSAIEMTLQNDYDIIFMDIQMPIMDGIEAMKIIKDHRPNQVVIAMTAYDAENHSSQFIELGFDDYLGKPITPKSIVNIIHKITTADQFSSSIYTPMYDFGTIQELANYVDWDTMVITYREFEKSIEGTIEACQKAMETKSYSIIANHAHSIKGDAASIGLIQLAEKAKQIEKNIHKEQFMYLTDDLKTLYLMLEQIQDVIKEILNRLNHEYKSINS